MLFGAKLAAVEMLPKTLQYGARIAIKAEESAALSALSEREAQTRLATSEIIRKLVTAYRSAALALTTRQTQTPSRRRKHQDRAAPERGSRKAGGGENR